MPRYDYECPAGHVSERHVPLSEAPGPKFISCPFHRGTKNPGATHYEGCEQEHTCQRRAKRREVYTPGVAGDLPTRGSF